MIRNPQELTLAIQAALNRRAVVLSHIILAFTISIHTILWPNSEPYEYYLAIGLSAATLIMLFFRAFDFASINRHPLLYIILYQILTFIGITFLTEPATPYVLIPIITAMIANVYYGSKGIYATVAVFGLATIAKYFFYKATDPLGTESTLDVFVAFFVFWAVSSLFVNIQKVYDWDRTRLKELIKQSRIEQKRLTTLINNMTESVLMLDNQGEVRLYNTAALSLLNANTSLEQKRLDDIAKLEDKKGNRISFADLIPQDEQNTIRDDIILCYSELDRATISLIVSPLHTSFGEGQDYTGYIFTMRDVTKEKTLEDERNEFISVISHELRTPLTITEASISNAMISNDKNKRDDAIGESLDMAHQQTVMLADILNNLSTFAEAENNSLELVKTPLKPAELVENLVREFQKAADDKGLKITHATSKNALKEILSNNNYVHEILQNFVSNAIKYSEEGTVTVETAQEPDGRIRFSVRDEGLGIATSEQIRVFDKFYRSEDFRTRASGGTGLGLYISQKLARLLQAEIQLKSELGKGSTFTLLVPDLAPDDKK